MATFTSLNPDGRYDFDIMRGVKEDWDDLIGAGMVKDCRKVHKFGYADTAPSGVLSTIWDGNVIYPYPATAIAMTVVGGAGDTLAGTGAQKVVLQGLDANGDTLQEEVEMAGAGGVTTTGLFLRIPRIWVSQVGSAGKQSADITIKNGATLYAQISNGTWSHGQSLMALVTVPRGYSFLLTDWRTGVSATKSATAALVTRLHNGTDWSDQPFRTKHLEEVFQGVTHTQYKAYKRFDELTDIEIRVVAGSAQPVSATFDGLLIPSECLDNVGP